MPNAQHKKKIVIAPLDWGLGHATRCIPIINEFLKQNCEVQIATSGDALVLLRDEFPTLKFHSITSYRAEYSTSVPFMVKILLQLPKFLLAIKKEHKEIERLVEQEKIDWVVSDNRYGCWSRRVPSVLITHQVNIIMSAGWKWLEGLINFGNHSQIRKFSECWVPDFPNGVTGKMTASDKVAVKFIGMLSRFEKKNAQPKYDVLALISGPEPQRSLFEDETKKQLTTSRLNYFIVRGKPSENSASNVCEVNHLDRLKLNELIELSKTVISRPGYTTVMDLWKLGKRAIFIPTPGQTEQEYLAHRLMSSEIAFCQNQNEIDLPRALAEVEKYKGFDGFPSSPNLLAVAISNLLSK